MIVMTTNALRFPPDKLNVQANMIQSRNGQSQSEREQSEPRGRFTGQQLKLLGPEIYRQAVDLIFDAINSFVGEPPSLSQEPFCDLTIRIPDYGITRTSAG